MKVHRFIGNFDFSNKIIEIMNTQLVHQIARVLKLKIGEKIILSDGAGTEASGVIINIKVNKVAVQIENIKKELKNNDGKTLYLAILKRENFELAVQKATEIGIDRIVPIITARTIKTGLKRERLKKIIHEASEQSGRTTVPILSEIISFDEALKQVNENTAILFDISGVTSFNSNLKSLICFVGPEGGFTKDEIVRARSAELSIVSLGKNTLRGETAAIIGSYLLCLNK